MGVKYVIKSLIKMNIVAFWQCFGQILPQTIPEISFDLQLGGGSRTTFSMSVS